MLGLGLIIHNIIHFEINTEENSVMPSTNT